MSSICEFRTGEQDFDVIKTLFIPQQIYHILKR